MVAPAELRETSMLVAKTETQVQLLDDHAIDLVSGGTVKEGLALLAVTWVLAPVYAPLVSAGVALGIATGAT
jgi:hypothetical protein